MGKLAPQFFLALERQKAIRANRVVTAGSGLAQGSGGVIQQIRPGDVVWFPAGERHWHGASPTTAMTLISIVEQLDGTSADWMEKVSDE